MISTIFQCRLSIATSNMSCVIVISGQKLSRRDTSISLQECPNACLILFSVIWKLRFPCSRRIFMISTVSQCRLAIRTSNMSCAIVISGHLAKSSFKNDALYPAPVATDLTKSGVTCSSRLCSNSCRTSFSVHVATFLIISSPIWSGPVRDSIISKLFMTNLGFVIAAVMMPGVIIGAFRRIWFSEIVAALTTRSVMAQLPPCLKIKGIISGSFPFPTTFVRKSSLAKAASAKQKSVNPILDVDPQLHSVTASSNDGTLPASRKTCIKSSRFHSGILSSLSMANSTSLVKKVWRLLFNSVIISCCSLCTANERPFALTWLSIESCRVCDTISGKPYAQPMRKARDLCFSGYVIEVFDASDSAICSLRSPKWTSNLGTHCTHMGRRECSPCLPRKKFLNKSCSKPCDRSVEAFLQCIML